MGLFDGFGQTAGIAALAPAIGAGTALSGGLDIWNAYQQYENTNYQKDLQNRIFGREDNSIQRRTKDLEAAGLSPVLAAGNGANAGAVVNTTAPQVGDIGGKAIAMLKMGNDISVSKTQQDLMKAQKKVADGQADTIKWDLDWYKNQPGGGMPTNMSNVGKDAGYLTGALEAFVKKFTDSAKGSANSYDQKMGEYERKIEDTVKKGVKKVKEGHNRVLSDPDTNYSY